MSIEQVFIDTYIKEINLAYTQMGSLLRNTVTVRSGVKGETVKFPKMGTATSVRNKARHADVVNSDIQTDFAQATMVDFTAGQYIDTLDELKADNSYRAGYTTQLLAKLAEDMDDLVFEAIDEITPVGITLPNANQLDTGALIKIGQAMSDAKIPQDGNRYALISTGAQADLLNDPKLTSKDYISNEFLNKGFVNNVMGLNMTMTTRLPVAAPGRKCFFFPKSAIGLGIALEPKVEINYIPQKRSWLISVGMMAAATVIREEAVFSAIIAD